MFAYQYVSLPLECVSFATPAAKHGLQITDTQQRRQKNQLGYDYSNIPGLARRRALGIFHTTIDKTG